MFKNHVKIAIRSLLRFKAYTTINLVGLSLGLFVGTMILVFVLDEFSFDQFHSKRDRIYRVTTAFYKGDESGGANQTNGWPVGKVLETEFPEVEAVLYSRNASHLLVNFEGKRIRHKSRFATPEFFTMFNFPLKKGNALTALNEPYSVVISEKLEKQYFGSENGLDKTLLVADTLHFKVTGVMANMPDNSHIQQDMIISFSTLSTLQPDFSFETGWGNINMHNYILLKSGTDFNSFASKAKNIYMDKAGEMLKSWGVSAHVEFEPLPDIYLKSKSGNALGPAGSIDRVYLVTGIAIFVLILACINFINLTTARSVYRSKEVGIRKVSGSTRMALIGQFLSESFILTMIGFALAVVLIWISLPYINQLLGKSYEFDVLAQPMIIMVAGLLIVAVSFLSGYYPAWSISAIRPADVLKGKLSGTSKGKQLRRGLVVFQFLISGGLVTGTLIVLEQLNFMQKQNLGFNKDQILVVNAARVNPTNPQAFETFKNQLKSHTIIEEVSYTNALPSVPGWRGQVAYPEGREGDRAISVEYMAVDENYLKLLDLQLVAGRGFQQDRIAELENGLVLNESAVSRFGWASPQEAIGKKISSPSGAPAGEVIGVVKDYHQSGLQQKIDPIALDYSPERCYMYAIRYKAGDTQQLMAAVEELWKNNFSGYDFNYFFLDDSFADQYKEESRLANVLSLFASITIIIAVIGLLGLVSFMVVSRTKEIGVRKILGANIFSITRLLSTEFIGLVLVANIISVPIIWYLANQWLERFAYRMQVSPLLFLSTSIAALLIALVTISFQTIKASVANPVDSLRSE